jgi:hypothetical protein
MAHLCHVEVANKAHVPPGNSALCFSIKCRIHGLLNETVGFMGCSLGWLHLFSNLRRVGEQGLGAIERWICILDRNVARATFPGRQAIAESAVGSSSGRSTQHSKIMSEQ